MARKKQQSRQRFDLLIPPDFNACQCEITPPHSPFALGPRPMPQMCGATPQYIAYEISSDDGKLGSMSVCNACVVEFKNQGLLSRARLAVIPTKRPLS